MLKVGIIIFHSLSLSLSLHRPCGWGPNEGLPHH